jgi:predicted DsbA family dithiol-disulfide isomerase
MNGVDFSKNILDNKEINNKDILNSIARTVECNCKEKKNTLTLYTLSKVIIIDLDED